MRLMTILITIAILMGLDLGQIRAQDRATQVRQDLATFLAGGQWIYNDLPRGFEVAFSFQVK